MEQSIQQLYESNSSRKYPFDDTHTYDVPDDIVLDMSLSVPPDVTPVVTVISVTESYFFMAIEQAESEEAIGHVIVNRPVIGRIYDIETTMDDTFGWIVLGPGRNTVYENRELSLGIDPSVLIKQPVTTNYFNEIQLDGFTFTDLEGKLSLTNDSPYINISVETRNVSGVGSVKCIVLSRNDAEVPVETIYGGLLESSQSNTGLPATKIAGVVPDDNYNINITLPVGTIGFITETGETNRIGIVLNADIDACQPNNPLRLFTHGKCDEGIQIDGGLPLDGVVEELKPEYTEEDCGCE